MRTERQSGQVEKMRAVENAHEELTGAFKPYYGIATELYDRHGTAVRVRAEIERLYQVTVSHKTASQWVNRGLAERRAEQPSTLSESLADRHDPLVRAA